MSDVNLLVSAGTVEPEEPVVVSRANAVESEGDSEGGMPPFVRLAQQALRGRYLLVGVLGMVLAGVGAAVGWYSTKPLYRSESLIRFSYDVPRILAQQGEYRPMEVFEATLQSQVALITSARVVGKALQSPLWAEKGFTHMATANIDGFASELKVEHKAGTEHLNVSYSSEDPAFASLAVRTVVDAYTEIYNAIDRQGVSERTAALESRRAELQEAVAGLEKELREESVEFGSTNIERIYDTAVQRLTRVDSALVDVGIALALAKGAQAGSPGGLTPAIIARTDPTMARYVAEREDLEGRIEQLRLRGYGEGHKQVQEAHRQLEVLAERMKAYAVEYQAQGLSPTAAGPISVATAGLAGRSVEELKADEANLTRLSQEAKSQMVAVGAKKLKIEGLQKQITADQAELSEAAARLNAMLMESALSGRMGVMSTGEVPLLPYRNRRPQMATAGGALGLFLPAALLVGISTLNRRYRYSTDAADDLSGRVPLLGILPLLPTRLTDPESAADAAQCVHQIRVMLQVQSEGRKGPTVYHVTSACPGEGKTSLVAALALSYAATGLDTLVIDADLVGQRLTRGYGMEERAGMREAISGGLAEGLSWYPTGVAHLSVLPAGVSDGRDACVVSAGSVKRVITAARQRFDVILVDSGPILGSLEALVMAGIADGVVLAISREQGKPLVDRAIRQLRSVGARIAGVVFNKAERRDFRHSVGVSSLRSIPRMPGTLLVRAGVSSTSGFGSLVDSVKTYLPGAA